MASKQEVSLTDTSGWTWVLVPILAFTFWWLMTREKSPPSSGPPRRYSAKRTASTPRKALPAPAASSGPTSRPSAARTAVPPSSGPPRRWVTPRRGQAFEALFEAATAQYQLPPGLLSRVAARESAYNPNARSSAGALGLMQIVPKWHPEVGAEGALDPKRAIPYAAKYLRQLYDRFGKWTLAVAAYNAGPSAVRKYGGVPPFDETRAYVAAILPDVGIVQPEPGVRYV